MKKVVIVVILLAAGVSTIFLLKGCSADKSREEKVSAMINKVDSPFFIVSMTPQNLMDKSGVMDGVLPFTYELILSFFIDESVTGIDYSVKSQVVVGKGEGMEPQTYGIFKVKDEAKFIDLLEKEANADILEKEGMKYAIKESEHYAVTWNEEFAIIANVPIDIMSFLMGKSGGEGGKVVDRCIEIIKAAEEGEANQTYTDFLKSDEDIAMYYDGAGFYQYMKDMMMEDKEAIEAMRETYEGVSYEMFLNFNNGSIDFEMISHITDELKKDLSFIASTGVDKKFLNYGKSVNPILLGAYHFEPDGLLSYLEEVMTEKEFSRMEEDINQKGLDLEEAKSALSGQVLYMIDDIVQVEETIDFGYGDPYTQTNTEPIFAIVVGVSDPGVIQKIFAPAPEELTAGTQDMGSFDGEIPEYFENGVIKLGDAYLYLLEDILFMSNDSSWSNAIAAGNGKKVEDKKEVTKDMPFGIFVDFVAISKLQDLNDAEPYVNLFVDFYGSANIDGGKFSITLKDKETNALRVLTEQVANLLNEFEKDGQELLEKELDESVLEGLEEIDGEKIEETVKDAFDALDAE